MVFTQEHRPPRSLDALAGMAFARPRQFSEGEFLLEAGTAVTAIYLIRAGQVRCFLLEPDGREPSTAVLGRGQLVGTAPFLDRTVHHEFAASVREHGVVQPLSVRPRGPRFELVFGVRRLRAAIQAQLREVPCIIRDADDDQALLLNALENLHREALSSTERIRTIERLAVTGLVVREISRRTGFNPSTISRWLRITSSPILEHAIEGRVILEHRDDFCRQPGCDPASAGRRSGPPAAECRHG